MLINTTGEEGVVFILLHLQAQSDSRSDFALRVISIIYVAFARKSPSGCLISSPTSRVEFLSIG